MDANLPNCPNIHVPRDIFAAVVRVESANNPFAVGVVGSRLSRQPKNLDEAIATVRDLESRGYNYSVGMAQVNRSNFAKYGLNKAELAFDICANLEAGSKILKECFSRTNGDWGKAFSCYYSGNFVTGYKHGYVQKVTDSFLSLSPQNNSVVPIQIIPSTRSKISNTAVAAKRDYGGNLLIKDETDATLTMASEIAHAKENIVPTVAVVKLNTRNQAPIQVVAEMEQQEMQTISIEKNMQISNDIARVF
jgi:type IV secretion system protein VirB1